MHRGGCYGSAGPGLLLSSGRGVGLVLCDSLSSRRRHSYEPNNLRHIGPRRSPSIAKFKKCTPFSLRRTPDSRFLYDGPIPYLNSAHTLSSAGLVLQNAGAIAAADFGPLAVRADVPLVSGLGAAFAAPGWCISARAPPRQLTRLVLRLYA